MTLPGAPVPGDLAEEFSLAAENAELRGANRRLLQANARLKAKEADIIAAVYQAAKDAAVTVGRPEPIPRPARDRRRSPEVALLHMTDWQTGKVTESYSTEIACERVRATVAKTIKLTEIQRADHPVREVVVMLGGDMIENVSIFPGQPWEVDSSAFSQVFTVSALIEEVILSLLDAFEKVTVHEVAGNHGRIGRKGDSPRHDNLDRIVYRIARDRVGPLSRLTWEENPKWYDVVTVGEYRALLVHGDQVKSFGGNVPAYGLIRKSNSWAAGGIPETFHDVYVGHMHQPMTLQLASGGMVYMTPSTESGSAYAREFMAAHGRPGQRLHFIDPVRGRVTAGYLIDFE